MAPTTRLILAFNTLAKLQKAGFCNMTDMGTAVFTVGEKPKK